MSYKWAMSYGNGYSCQWSPLKDYDPISKTLIISIKM